MTQSRGAGTRRAELTGGDRPPAPALAQRRRGGTYLPGCGVRESAARSRRSASSLLPPPPAPAPRRATHNTRRKRKPFRAQTRVSGSRRVCRRLREGLDDGGGPAVSAGGRSPGRRGTRGDRCRRLRRPGDPRNLLEREGCACARPSAESPWPAGAPRESVLSGLRARTPGAGPALQVLRGVGGMEWRFARRRSGWSAFSHTCPLSEGQRGEPVAKLRLRPIAWRTCRSRLHVTSDCLSFRLCED